MELNKEEDEYLKKVCEFIDIGDYFNKIKSYYDELISYISENLKFPNEDYNSINELIKKFKSNFGKQKNLDSNEYHEFSNKLTNFLENIKKIIIENEIFKKLDENIKSLTTKLNEFSFNYFGEINESVSTNMLDTTDENKKSLNNFSYLYNDFKNSNNASSEDDFQVIRFACFICDKQPLYFCKNHCYRYFCDTCIEKDKLSSHQFENIDNNRENSKILFINSFINLFKVYCQMADKIFRTNLEKIEYPNLKNFNDLDSQTEFLKDIYNFRFENNSFDNNYQSGLCKPIKDALNKVFELNISGIESIDQEYSFINENKVIKDEYLKIKQKYEYKSYYTNILVKNQKFLNEITKEYIDKNFNDCKLLINFKNIIHDLIINQCKISKNKINYKYNFIIPNLNLNSAKGGEIYYAPYGWFGIGLNIENIYNKKEENENKNDSKAIAYYPFKGYNGDKIKEQLHNLIMNKDKNSNQNNQQNAKNRCFYLYHNISLAEEKTGTIYYNNKKYKIALMTRVPSNKIRQLPDSDLWLLRQDEIEFIRILFKEVMI